MAKLTVSANGGAVPAAGLLALRARLEGTAQRIIDALDALDSPGEDLEHGHDLEETFEGDELDGAEGEIGEDELFGDFQRDNPEDEPEFLEKDAEDREAIEAARVEATARLHRILRGRHHPLARPVVGGAL